MLRCVFGFFKFSCHFPLAFGVLKFQCLVFWLTSSLNLYKIYKIVECKINILTYEIDDKNLNDSKTIHSTDLKIRIEDFETKEFISHPVSLSRMLDNDNPREPIHPHANHVFRLIDYMASKGKFVIHHRAPELFAKELHSGELEKHTLFLIATGEDTPGVERKITVWVEQGKLEWREANT